MDIGHLATRTVRRLGEALFPQALFMSGLPGPAPVVVMVEALPIDEVGLRRASAAQRPVTAMLDPATALQRRIRLPCAAMAKAEAAIGLQLRQTLPGQGRGLIWRSELLGRQGDQAEYAVHILKESQIDELVANMRGAGVALHSVTIGKGRVQPLWQASPNAGVTFKRWVTFAGLMVASVSLASVILLEHQRAEVADLVVARASRVAALEERLLTAKSKSEEGKLQQQSVLSDMGTFAAQSRRLSQLLDLTNVLPDTVWVSELSITGDRMVFSGFAEGDVAPVIALLQQLPWAQSVQLNGPISYDSYSGQNRFEVGLTVAGVAG